MLQQYRRIKKNIPKGVILMFRLGDFYEMFFEDAKTASRILNIALTSRNKDKSRAYPMCGVPYHAAPAYISRLIKAGFKVAVCDQVEDPKLSKGIVRREVTRFITPATVLDTDILEDKRNNFLSSISKAGGMYGLSFLDLSTGEFKVIEFNNENELLTEFLRIMPSECVLPESFKEDKSFLDKIHTAAGNVLLTFYADWVFDYDACYRILREHFKTQSLDGFGCQGMVPGITSAGAILYYLKDNLHKSLGHIERITRYTMSDYMALDMATARNLELTEPMHIYPGRFGRQKDITLLSVLDITSTSMGHRLLRNWIRQPLVNAGSIKERQSAVKEFYNNKAVLDKAKDIIKEIPDIERIISRIDCGVGNARDLISVRDVLLDIPGLKRILEPLENKFIKNLMADLIELPELADTIRRALVDAPPISVQEGEIIRKGYSKELDELRNISVQAKEWLANLQAREIQRTGIKSLKVRYNKVFGYYIEISKSNLKAVPEDYIRRQTLVNAERFVVSELKEYETKIINAREEVCRMEYNIFVELRRQTASQTHSIQHIARSIAVLDALMGIALAALYNNYVFPDINDGPVINITAGRHPVLEQSMETDKRFVPNDTFLDCGDNQLAIITGPNMAGKSTYIRQVALLVLMAQIGSAIPAESAEIGVVDRIFTRAGARDEIMKGQSTFMVEMNETSYIVNNATSRSLIVLDEIGRGTSTFDGISIAWTVAEYLVRGQKNNSNEQFLGPKTLFATHYHELTELEHLSRGIKNYNIAVREWNDEIIFLYKIVPGSADKSYGIHVARLAGMPYSVLERAKEILAGLEAGSFSWKKKAEGMGPKQLYLFDTPKNKIVEQLHNLKLDYITPIEALNKLKELKKKAN